MTPTIALVTVLFVAAVLFFATLVFAVRTRQHIPAPNSPSDHFEELTRRLHAAHEESARRTSALYRDLEAIRKGVAGHEK